MTVKTPFMQQQKMLMYVFPVIFAVLGINFPVGVLIYWLTTNVWTMGQQMFVIYRNPTPGSLAFQQRQERLRAKGKLVEQPEEIAAKEAVEVARANRTQPKRQPKAKRHTGGAPGGPGAPRAGGSAGDAQADAPQDDTAKSDTPKSGTPKSGTPKGGASRSGSGGKSSGGAPRAGAPRAGGQKQGGGTPGKQPGGAKSKPTNLSSKKK
jgi:YidC/Oxa1 family membrane protein insertase